MITMDKMLDELGCYECGKIFYVHNRNAWAYKKYVGNRPKMFCSWKCLQICRKRMEENDGRRKRNN